MSSAEQLIKLLDFNLTQHNFDNAKKLLNDENQFGQTILSNYPEVIQQVVLKHLTANNYEKQPELYEACEYILSLFAEKCHQQGILFEFLEILENVKDDDVFRSILKSLQVILLKQSESKTRSLEYTLNSIEDYILELELSDVFKKKYLDEEEEKLLENDEKIRRILMNYLTLDLFYQPILKQIIENHSNDKKIFRVTKYNRQNVLFCFILRLLGKPLSHLNLSHDSESNKVKTYSRDVAENLVKTLCKLYPDVFNILQYIEFRCRWPQKDKIDDDLFNIFLHPEKVPLLQFGILLYLIIVENINYETLPQTYSPNYLFKTGIYCINEMIVANDTVAPKGLKLCYKMLSKITECLSSDELDIKIHEDFCNNLIKLLIYSPSKKNRQSALIVMRTYILKFDIAGRYLLIKNIMSCSTHKGLIGYLSTLYKNIILESINDETLPSHLSGFNFKQLLFNFICKLEGGVQCDITESSDQIIAALNFLNVIIQRDKTNKTGIRSHLSDLKIKYLCDLRSALDFSRAHFTAEIERVKINVDTKCNKQDDDVVSNFEILNDNAPLAEITKEKKMEMLHSALATFDLIDFHLARVNEIIHQISIKIIFTESQQWYKTSSCLEFRSILDVSSCTTNPLYISRSFHISSLTLYAEKNIEDFRAREEQKESEYNQQPLENENSEKEKQSNEEDEQVLEVKNKILEAALEFVTVNGWTRQSIVKGAEKSGYPSTIHGMFSNGGIELINYFYLKCNKELVEKMRERVGDENEKVADPKQFVSWAIQERLIMIRPYIKTWPQALAMMTLPPNVPTSLANMLTLVDDICYFSGDRSVDFNWYARRIGLATIYKATELYMLQDSSINNENTWKFLERRIADASLVHDVLVQSESATQHLSQAVGSAFITARNILGLNFDRR
ncbi:hypothetical protein PVAND_002683 [Polypedilum vanderplanki]|uniref:Ubiquinone biosynthesis protein n=1 Tax=Polypedilum vanderplanki TaxID=319348 RepID=A0A9J6BTC9_POLVA|nr:hypothetical protein PVAND_002683 [Polypedilum vanderplanki]